MSLFLSFFAGFYHPPASRHRDVALLRNCYVCLFCISLFGCLFFWWLLLASSLPPLPSTTTSQIDISPPPTIPHTTRHLWETKHSRFGSRVLQQKIFVWQFCPKCVCLLLSVGKIALLVCWGSVVCVCSVSLCLFVCLFVCFLGGFCYPPASFHFPPAQPRRPPLLAAFSAPHVISEKSNTPISEAEFCNRRASFCNFGRKVLLLLLVCWSLCFFFFLVASVSLPTPFTSLHHNLADWHLPSSHHPPHHTSSLRNQTLPFRKPGFATEDLRLAILSEMCLPVVVCWQDCSSCLLRKCCVCLFCISYFWPNSNAAKPSQNIQKHRNS